MFVYCIENQVNNKKYIGQTTREDPNSRFREHVSSLSRGIHNNQHLQNAWNKYGEEFFEFYVLKEAETQAELDDVEKKLVNKFGYYNNKEGGKGGRHSLKTRKKLSEAALGRESHLKGTTFVRSKEVKLEQARRQRPQGYLAVVSPNGEVFEFENLRAFCREHDLHYGGLTPVMDGRHKHYRGWRLASTPRKYTNTALNISKARRKEPYPDVVSPDGTIYSIEILSEFCREHDLSVSNMCLLVNHKKPSYKGWVVKTED